MENLSHDTLKNVITRLSNLDRSLFLYGARKFGKIALENLRKCIIEPAGFVDDNEIVQGSFVEGVKVYSLGG